MCTELSYAGEKTIPIKNAAPRAAFLSEITGKRTYQPVTSRRALPISASDRTVFTPASSRAANFSAAVPLPPAMMAPA